MKTNPFQLAAGVALVVFVLFVVLSTYYTVDQGQRAVVLHYGAVAGESEPGLHFKYPFITTVQKISIQPQTFNYGSKDQPFEAYSKDQQPADLQLSVTFHVTDASKLYALYGSIEGMVSTILTPRVYEQMKNVFGQFNAIEAIQNRAVLNAQVTNAIISTVKGPFVIDSVQLQDIAFSQSYENAVEQRMQAIVQQEQAEAVKAKRIIDADAAAYEVKAAADAQAHQIEVQGQAEAAAIRARGDALRDNPNLIALTTAEKWDGKLPETMVPGGALPFLEVGHK